MRPRGRPGPGRRRFWRECASGGIRTRGLPLRGRPPCPLGHGREKKGASVGRGQQCEKKADGRLLPRVDSNHDNRIQSAADCLVVLRGRAGGRIGFHRQRQGHGQCSDMPFGRTHGSVADRLAGPRGAILPAWSRRMFRHSHRSHRGATPMEPGSSGWTRTNSNGSKDRCAAITPRRIARGPSGHRSGACGSTPRTPAVPSRPWPADVPAMRVRVNGEAGIEPPAGIPVPWRTNAPSPRAGSSRRPDASRCPARIPAGVVARRGFGGSPPPSPHDRLGCGEASFRRHDHVGATSRSRWDSNPRAGARPANTLAGCPFRPLGHDSGTASWRMPWEKPMRGNAHMRRKDAPRGRDPSEEPAWASSRAPESDRRPAAYEAAALPTELTRRCGASGGRPPATVGRDGPAPRMPLDWHRRYAATMPKTVAQPVRRLPAPGGGRAHQATGSMRTSWSNCSEP